MVCDYCSFPKNEGQFLHLSQPLSVTKPATELHTWHVLCFLQITPPPSPSLVPSTSSADKKIMDEVYLLYVLMISLWCKMCGKCQLLSLNTGECAYALWAWKVFVLSFYSSPAYCLTNISWHWTLEFAFYSITTFINNVLFFPSPPFYLKRFLQMKICERNMAFIVKTFQSMLKLRWFLQCHIDTIWSAHFLIVDSETTLHSKLFNLNSRTAVAWCQGKPDFGIRSECMSAENLCTTYYLVLLFSIWTPALRCGVYLFTCLCLTLCALHCRSLLCFVCFGWVMMKWLWMGCPPLISYILVVHISHLYHWSSPWPCPSFLPTHIFFIFWYKLWLHILPQLSS